MKYKFNIISLFFLVTFLFGGNNILFDSINGHLKQYKQNISNNDLSIEQGILQLRLKGRRTNHKSLSLLGFYSIGKQLQKHSIHIKKIKINIQYEMKETQQVTFTASKELVMNLAKGSINPKQFMNRIEQLQ